MSSPDRLAVLALFLRITELGSFRAAAAETGFTPSAASRAIQRLEDQVGVRLLERTTRIVRPTDQGAQFARRCAAILEDIEEAETEARRGAIRGMIRVDVQGTLARRYVLPRLGEFFARHPDIRLRMSETERFVDPVAEGVDCVLRIGELRDSALVGRRVALLPEAVVASPGYLARHGVPQVPEDLAEGHVAVGFVSRATGEDYPFTFRRGGEEIAIRVPSVLSVTAAESYAAAAELGLGIVQKPRYHAEAALAAGRLVEVLAEFAPEPMPVTLLHPPGRRLAPRVRVFADWLAGLFRDV